MAASTHPTLAIVGANSFVGSRAVELFHLRNLAGVRPIVRSAPSLARLSRFDLDCRIADALDLDALTRAFEGCEWVLHSVHGAPEVTERAGEVAYRAACRAGVRRMVYLSSASVHGQAPEPGTDESTPLNDKQPLIYNNSKVRAERRLAQCRENVELVSLRPGIVFGPRDRWISELVRELRHGLAYLVGGGEGFCNSIYVDNLIHAVELGFSVPQAAGETFLVGDNETFTWRELYASVAGGIGVSPSQIRQVARPEFRQSLGDRAGAIRSHALVQAALPWIPPVIKRVAKGALGAIPAPPSRSPWRLPHPPSPAVSREMADLHACRWKLDSGKARRLLNYSAPVPVETGLRRTLDWLRWAWNLPPSTHE